MSLFNRRAILGFALLPLAACGFEPVYGDGRAGERIRNQIAIEAPVSRLEFVLASRLEDRIGTGSAYSLSYELQAGRREQAIDGADNINRVNLPGHVNFTLTDTTTGQVVEQGSVATFTAYTSAGSPVATASGRRDAEDRLAVALADQLVTRLIAGAPTWP